LARPRPPQGELILILSTFNSQPPLDLLDEIESRVLCADGATGTLLIERGVSQDRCFEELCVSEPNRIRQIHSDYIAAGARIIKTNSFGANAVRLARFELEHHVNEINWHAAQLAKQAAQGHNVHIAGSVGPLGVSLAEAGERKIDVPSVFREQMGALLDGGVRVVLLETFQSVDELAIALHIKHELHHCPVICSLAPSETGALPDGTSLADAFKRLTALDADILALNCVGPDTALRLLQLLPRDLPIAVSPSAGAPNTGTAPPTYDLTPAAFAEAAAEMAALGARIIGGCCGIHPPHIAAAAKRLPGP
jgi:methionine synthase I (cobalamin-dependent)